MHACMVKAKLKYFFSSVQLGDSFTVVTKLAVPFQVIHVYNFYKCHLIVQIMANFQNFLKLARSIACKTSSLVLLQHAWVIRDVWAAVL